MTNNKTTTSTKVIDESTLTVECPELNDVTHFDLEEKCFEGQYYSDPKLPYLREKPVNQITWETFKSRAISSDNQKWFTKGENGIRKGLDTPHRYVTSIIRVKVGNSEKILTNNKIVAYNIHGDEITYHILLPERWTKTYFKYESVPNYETGFSERVNTGISGHTTEYFLDWSKNTAKILFDMRLDDNIQFSVRNDDADKVVGIKAQDTLEDTFKLFTENDFQYLFAGNYLTFEEKMLSMKRAEQEGIISPLTDAERFATVKQQELESKKDMQSYR